MIFHYMGKYDMNPESLPHQEHMPGAVAFKEPEDTKKLGLIANGISLGIALVTIALLFLRGGFRAWNIFGALAALVAMFPHEFLHALCFKEDVYMYTNLQHGMLFVVGPERMSRQRFLIMSLLPNIVFGFLPFILFLVFPSLSFLGTLGAISIPMGAGDYLNVFNALTQMPKGAYTYLYGFHSYWYMPGENTAL
ncbi:MAG: DUF3267 domain-containing protein [Oscillospiraceae bacterium]|nr:DUF3267 domain-containing protein [Oscillospiraceae bacterium]